MTGEATFAREREARRAHAPARRYADFMLAGRVAERRMRATFVAQYGFELHRALQAAGGEIRVLRVPYRGVALIPSVRCQVNSQVN
jgi:hypothetical protein